MLVWVTFLLLLLLLCGRLRCECLRCRRRRSEPWTLRAELLCRLPHPETSAGSPPRLLPRGCSRLPCDCSRLPCDLRPTCVKHFKVKKHVLLAFKEGKTGRERDRASKGGRKTARVRMEMCVCARMSGSVHVCETESETQRDRERQRERDRERESVPIKEIPAVQCSSTFLLGGCKGNYLVLLHLLDQQHCRFRFHILAGLLQQ